TVSRLSLKCRAPPGTSPFPYTTLFRSGLLEAAGQRGLRRTVEVRARTLEIDMVNVFTREGELLGVMNPRLPPATADAESGEALAEAALGGRETDATIPFGAGELVRAAAPVTGAQGKPVGAVIVSTYL